MPTSKTPRNVRVRFLRRRRGTGSVILTAVLTIFGRCAIEGQRDRTGSISKPVAVASHRKNLDGNNDTTGQGRSKRTDLMWHMVWRFPEFRANEMVEHDLIPLPLLRFRWGKDPGADHDDHQQPDASTTYLDTARLGGAGDSAVDWTLVREG
jgi:hypothetical protein